MSSKNILTSAGIPDPQPPGLVEERWLKTVHVVLVQGVLHVVVVEERELVVDLRDPRAIAIVLALGDLVNLLLKLLQTWGVRIIGYRNIRGKCKYRATDVSHLGIMKKSQNFLFKDKMISNTKNILSYHTKHTV